MCIRDRYIAGLAVNKSKTKILVAGSQANVRFAADEPVNLIVRAVDNKTDPMSIVRVFAMKNNRKQRSAVISAVGSFNVTSNDMEYLSLIHIYSGWRRADRPRAP